MKKYKVTIITIILFAIAICLALFIGDIGTNLESFWAIQRSQGILLSDHMIIGNLNATILNVLITVGLNLIIVKSFKVKLEGPVIAGLLTIAGFAFIGKNVWNALPIYLGVITYAKFKKVEMSSLMAIMLLSSGISPLVSYLVNGYGMIDALPYFIARLPIAIGSGMVAGFLIPIVYIQALKFHNGMNLYNTGFTMGLIAVLAHGILRSLGVAVRFVPAPIRDSYGNLVYPDYTWQLFLIIGLISITLIILAYCLDSKVHQQYKKILSSTGALVSNFPKALGYPVVFLNMGIMGLVVLTIAFPLILILQIPFLGVIAAASLTIIGFAAFGKHPRNTIPIMVGTLIGLTIIVLINSNQTLLNADNSPNGSLINMQVLVSGVFFATCLAPLSKEYGIIQGIIAGIVHMLIVMIARSFQGGFDLYNNGFAAGFVAGILVPIFETFRKDDKLEVDVVAPIEENIATEIEST